MRELRCPIKVTGLIKLDSFISCKMSSEGNLLIYTICWRNAYKNLQIRYLQFAHVLIYTRAHYALTFIYSNKHLFGFYLVMLLQDQHELNYNLN